VPSQVADLVFPWFIFIMGAALPIALRARAAARPTTGWQSYVPPDMLTFLQVCPMILLA